jgi:hypothetical protein
MHANHTPSQYSDVNHFLWFFASSVFRNQPGSLSLHGYTQYLIAESHTDLSTMYLPPNVATIAPKPNMGLNAVSTRNHYNIGRLIYYSVGMLSAALHLPITEMEFLSYDVN